MDIQLSLMAGIDIPVQECQLVFHQPSITEIAYIGYQTFFSGVYTVSLKKSMFVEDESLLVNTTNFQIFMTVIAEKEAVSKKNAVIQVLQMICPKHKVSILPPRSILFIREDNQVITVDESNFEALQDIVQQMFCLNQNPSGVVNYNPANAQAKAIADKLMRGRQRIAAEKGESNACVFSQYVSSLAVGLQLPLKDCLNLTVYQLYDLVERYQLYTSWDIDIRCRLAGGKPDSKPDNWMKNIH